jgi:WD40 repeat protein
VTIGGDERTTAADEPPAVWDTKTGERLARLGDDASIYAAAFTADAQRVLGGGESGVIRLWD